MSCTPNARRTSTLLIPALVVVAASTLFSGEAAAQYRNNGIKMPAIGWMGMWTTDWVQGLYDNTWDASDQVTIGTGYFRALGYNLWLDVEVDFNAGTAKFSSQPFWPLIGFNSSVGLRYNFLDEEFRPFVAGHVHYLWMFNTFDAGRIPPGPIMRVNDPNQLFSGFGIPPQSMWVGVRGGGGFEWFFLPTFRNMGVDIPLFYDEMSLQAEFNPAVFADLAGIPLLSSVARISYNVYF
jgi:hypothetical protein